MNYPVFNVTMTGMLVRKENNRAEIISLQTVTTCSSIYIIRVRHIFAGGFGWIFARNDTPISVFPPDLMSRFNYAQLLRQLE